MNSNFEKVKIVVVGDSGVGKTSLVHLIAHQEVLKKPNWTIGCSVDVKIHEFKDGTIQHKAYFIEFFDIGGNIAHKSSAKIFYSGADGIILVHDLTNRKSQDNLKQWLADIIEQNENILTCSSEHFSSDTKVPSSLISQYLKQSTNNINLPPILVVGTKLDQAQMVRNSNMLRTASPIATHYKSDEINLVIENKKLRLNQDGSYNGNEKSNYYLVQSERATRHQEGANLLRSSFSANPKTGFSVFNQSKLK